MQSYCYYYWLLVMATVDTTEKGLRNPKSTLELGGLLEPWLDRTGISELWLDSYKAAARQSALLKPLG